MGLDYPRENIEMVIVSGSSTDKTEAIAGSFKSDRLKVVVQNKRTGKTEALNKAFVTCTGEILLFTDANSMLQKDSVKKLVRHLRIQKAMGL